MGKRNKVKNRLLNAVLGAGLALVVVLLVVFFVIFSLEYVKSGKKQSDAAGIQDAGWLLMKSFQAGMLVQEEVEQTETGNDDDLIDEDNPDNAHVLASKEYVQYRDTPYKDTQHKKVGTNDADADDKVQAKRDIPLEESKVLFKSGIGTHNSDKMNYMDYESEIYFQPIYDMEINTVKIEIYSCLKECSLVIEIYDESGNLLGESYSSGTEPDNLNGVFYQNVVLKSGEKYKIHQYVSSKKSVGIYTAPRKVIKNNAAYTTIYSKSKYYEAHEDKGPIAFSIKGIYRDTSEFDSASWSCQKNRLGKRGETIIYEFNEFKKGNECKSKNEWMEIAGVLCNSLCENDSGCEYTVKNGIFGNEC